MVAAAAALTAGQTGRPGEAERWADAVDRWRYGGTPRPEDPIAEAWAAVLRALMCRQGPEQMRADADDAARRLTAAGIVAPIAPILQGLARVLCGDPGGAEAFFEDGSGIGEVAATDVLVALLFERFLLAMARNHWDQAEQLAGQARSALRQAGAEDPLVSTVAARVAIHRGEVGVARRELVTAQRLRHIYNYATPHLAVQFRAELIRVHLALSDLAGARTLMAEIDEVLKRRPGLGVLAGEAAVLRDRLARERGPSVPRASALTAAELRLLPLLATHLSVPQIAAELFLSPHTIKSQMKSIYRKLGSSTRAQTVTRARDVGLLEG
jgi:LuxR family maltose regulon positive regulatory protein